MKASVPMINNVQNVNTQRSKETVNTNSTKQDQQFSKAMDAAIAGKQAEKNKVAFETKGVSESDSESSDFDNQVGDNAVLPLIIPFTSVVIPVAPQLNQVIQNSQPNLFSEYNDAIVTGLSVQHEPKVVSIANKSSDFLGDIGLEPENLSVDFPTSSNSNIVDAKTLLKLVQDNPVFAQVNSTHDETYIRQTDSGTTMLATGSSATIPELQPQNKKLARNIEQQIPLNESVTSVKEANSEPSANLGVFTQKSELGNDVRTAAHLDDLADHKTSKNESDNTDEKEMLVNKNAFTDETGFSKTENKHSENVFSEVLQRTTSIEQKTYTSETKNATSQFVKDTHQITSQIVEQAQVIKNNQETQMIIKLKPEHLGELTLKVTVDSGVVSASFHSNNAEVRNVIEASLLQLKQEMSNQGLKVDNVGVYAGLGQFLSNGQRETPQQPVVKFKNKRVDEEAFEELEMVSSARKSLSETEVDYRI